MSAKQSGSLGTLLFAVPLAAIPLMAIFGIPEFAHVSASTGPEADGLVRRSALTELEENTARGARPDGIRLPTAGSLSSPSSEQAPTASSGAASRRADESMQSAQRRPGFFRDVTAAQEPTAPAPRSSPRPAQTAAVAPVVAETGNQPPPIAGAATPAGLTWREAARRLEEIGITNYRLERGLRADQFQFVCLFSPGKDARIIQRFEAESSDPLLAVEDVLAQIQAWLEHRYAQSRTWVR